MAPPAGDIGRIGTFAKELVELSPDIIVGYGTPVVVALQQETRSIPILFLSVTDPVGQGLVASLAHPGGNATGFVMFEYGIAAKWLELLKEIAPGAKRVAVLREPTVAGIGQLAAMQTAAPSFGVELQPIDVSDAGGIERALGLRARVERRSDRALEHIGDRPPRADRHAGGPAPTAGDLSQPSGCGCRRPDLLWTRWARPVSARRCLHRQDPQGRKTFRSPRGAGFQISAGDQPKDRQGSRRRSATEVLARADEVIE
jgi:hypothetical protein